MTRLLPLLLSCAALLYAQETTGTVAGIVSDPGGAIVPGAKVEARNSGTNLKREAQTDGQGHYRLPSLPPGRYEVTVSAAGFKHSVFTDIRVEVEQVVTLNAALELGATSETVTVEGGASLVQFESTTVGQVIENRRVMELPLNGRRFLQLTTLVPGTTAGYTRDVSRQGGERSQRDFNIAVNGTRAEFNNLLLDGVLNVDENFGTFIVSPSIDAIQEFKVQTSSYSAQFGRGGGAQINIVTKSGTNQLHGSAFEFLRNAKLDAKNYFDRPSDPIPPFKQNQYGFTAGGPVLLPKIYDGRNRSFFLANFEGQRIRQAQTTISTVPLAIQRSGDLTGGPAIFDPGTGRPNPANPAQFQRDPFPGNRIPTARIDPTSQYLLQFNPLPNLGGAANNYLSNEGRKVDNNQFTLRGDHTITAKNSLFFRYSYSDEDSFLPANFVGMGTLVDVRGQVAALGDTHVFGPQTINEFRLGFSRLRNALLQQNAYANDFTSQAGIQGLSKDPIDFGIPSVSVQGLSGWGDAAFAFPSLLRDNVFQLTENLSLIRGRHNMNLGAELRRFYFNNFANNLGRGSFNFRSPLFTSNPVSPAGNGTGFADYLLGAIGFAEGAIGDTSILTTRPSWNFYFQDDWKATRKLTLSLGLRYELNPYPVEKYDRIESIDLSGPVPTLVRAGSGDPYENYPRNIRLDPAIGFVRDGRFGRTLLATDKNDWSPRIGFAYAANLKTAIRGGYGVYYAQDLANAFFDLARNVPRNVRSGLTSSPDRPEFNYRTVFLGLSSGQTVLRPTVTTTDPSYRTSYIQQWSLNLQREIRRDLVLEVGYLGTKGTKLGLLNLFNSAPAAAGAPQPRRPFPQLERVFLIQHRLNSNYRALQVKLEKKFSHGIGLLSSYTLGRSYDYASSTRTTGEGNRPIDPSNLRLEYGRSLFDARHNFVFNTLWEVPFLKANKIAGGWQISGIFQSRTGLPFTAGAGGDIANTGNDASGRANLVSGQTPELSRSERGPRRWFNTAAFATPAPFTFGNAGRNTVEAPGLVNVDLSAIKNFRFTEQTYLQFRAEFFNLTNTPAFGVPNRSVNGAGFGTIASAGPARQIQFALKLVF